MDIRLRNLKDGQTVSHSIIVIEGDILGTLDSDDEDDSEKNIYIRASRDVPDVITRWPIKNKRFKAVVQLLLGKNDFYLGFNKSHFRLLSLVYEPLKTDRFVRLLYVVASDDVYNGHFQGPDEGNVEKYSASQAMAKISFNAKLVQAFVAESLYRHGLGRRTFRLESDSENGEPVCYLFKLKTVTTAQAYRLSAHDLWCLVRDELAEDDNLIADIKNCKYVAFISFTRYTNHDKKWPTTHKEMVELTDGYVALGGGGLAVLGTGCLHTWANNVHEVLQRFTDCTKVDRLRLLDDSGYRGTYWACYATTLGAMCHELGHTFGLCHSTSGMMGQGFGEIHRAFVLPELIENPDNIRTSSLVNLQDDWWRWHCSLRTPTIPSYPDGVLCSHLARLQLKRNFSNEFEAADWTRAEAIFLSYHKWFTTPCCKDSGEGPILYGTEIRARHRLKIVIMATEDDESNMTVKKYWEFTNGYGRLTFRLADDDLREVGASKIKIMAEDSYGNMLMVTLSEINY